MDIVYAYPQWSSVALYEAGKVFERMGKLDLAREQYNQCITKYKDADSASLAKERLKALDKAGK